jgi:ankyrin repeat protein
MGCTPLFVASMNGHVEVVKFLLDANADKSIKMTEESGGFTALFVAKHQGHDEVVALLNQ